MSNNTDDGWAREVIRSVEYMSAQLVEFRQQINRAMLPLYPRITEIEARAEREAKEREIRQKVLDAKLAEQNKVASQQGAAIQQTIGTLNEHSEILLGQDRKLDYIHRWQTWRTVIEALLIVGLLAWYFWPWG